MEIIRKIKHRIYKLIVRKPDAMASSPDDRTLLEKYQSLTVENKFILYELKRINETLRYHLLGDVPLSETDQVQTRSSFDYQWDKFHTGVAMSDDDKFMGQIRSQICKMTDFPAEWFQGKQVIDIGCGSGRFTYGLLSLGATVTAVDQSAAGLRRTTELCQEFSSRLSTRQENILEWDEETQFDLVFNFGVVHHTGNTYLAMWNVAHKVKPGGRLFLMIYGFPEDQSGFAEINSYEDVRQKIRQLPFDQKKEALIEQFGPYLAHGWFDATSPRINDLLTFPEIVDLLTTLGFQNVRLTLQHRNHHLIADKIG
jgi:2-polyprenyl-3-methyl-5-hydroxy-6-metoxy-1,4-benzoquinol methylase